jgi:hypothetical protein
MFEKIKISKPPLKKRYGHAAAMMGSMLLVHGGLNVNEPLDDFHCFDFIDRKWLAVSINYSHS